MNATALWLRCETKEFERRAALTPSAAQELLKAGFKIYVERDRQRIFADEEYEKYSDSLIYFSACVLIIFITGLAVNL